MDNKYKARRLIFSCFSYFNTVYCFHVKQNNKKMKNEKELLPIGTKVFDVRYGWGEVEKLTEDDCYSLICYFKGIGRDNYTKEGYYISDHESPLLSLTEYNLTEGGFTSVTEFDFDAPKVGDWGYFWSKPYQYCAYGELESIDKKRGFPYELKENRLCKYFSKELPVHIKELQEKE